MGLIGAMHNGSGLDLPACLGSVSCVTMELAVVITGQFTAMQPVMDNFIPHLQGQHLVSQWCSYLWCCYVLWRWLMQWGCSS
jgi:hypothetical protein